MSSADRVYRTFVPGKFFSKGWGCLETLERLLRLHIDSLKNKKELYRRISSGYEVKIDNSNRTEDLEIVNGHFLSPLAAYEPGLLPPESENARFQVVLPKTRRSKLPSICLHLAGTGDHFFWRRRNLIAKPLAREKGIASIILENPYYGSRKPKKQHRSYLHHVSDIFVMGAALIVESALLLDWCLKEGFQALGITGISMGGHMASISSCYWPHPIVIVPCLSWSTASCVFTEGVFRDSCAWPVLQEQLNVSDYSHLIKQFCNIDVTNTPNRPLQSLLHHPGSQQSAGLRTTSMALSTDSKFGHKWRVPSEALGFMQQIMDTFSHLANFPQPHPGSSIISVVSKDDQYFPRDNVTPLTDIWPNCEVRYISGGHVMGYLFNQKKFRTAISDAFDRLVLHS